MRRPLWKRAQPGSTARGNAASQSSLRRPLLGLSEQCACGTQFATEQGLRRHQKNCPAIREEAAHAFEEAEANEARRKRQRMHTNEVEYGGIHRESPTGTALETSPPNGEPHEPAITSLNVGDPAAQPSEPSQPAARRRRMLSRRVLDMLPGRAREGHRGSGAGGGGLTTELLSALDARTQTVGDSGPEPESVPVPEPSYRTPSPVAGAPDSEQARRSRFTTVRSRVNKFGLFEIFRHRPTMTAPPEPTLEERYEPRAAANATRASSRTLSDIIRPFPNLSSWLWSHWFWSKASSSKTKEDRRALQDLICRDDFHPEDIHGVNFDALEKELDETPLPWQDSRGGWRKSTLTIGIPTGVKPTQADRRAAASEARAATREAPERNTAPAIDVPGVHFEIPDFWHRSIPSVMRSVIGHDEASKDFVWEPYEQHFQPPGNPPPPPERVLHEMWTSDAFLEAHRELQASPPEPGCDLPRVIAGLILSSDGTHVAQFGQASLWPGYLEFANQSKYIRCRPQANATHHIGYIPKLPDRVREFIRRIPGRKGTVAPLLAHLRRELFHAAWGVMLNDDEFTEAYKHGMVLRCADGVVRRIYPRILVYSADYPEKVLVATIRDMGGCPCPRCTRSKDTLAAVGSKVDREARKNAGRADNQERQNKVEEARRAIYNDGYVVNSEIVEGLLKPESLVPTRNAFSTISNMDVHADFDVHKILMVDLMHEFELGVWKAVFAHLVRILEAHDQSLTDRLNERYRAMPTFGRSTIRRFTSDVSEMKKLAARDFEDMLQSQLDNDPDYRILHTGRILGRVVDAWRDLRKIINDGYARNPQLSGRDHYNELQLLHHELYERIEGILPTLPDDIRARGTHGTSRVAELLDKGRRAARNEDTNHIKTKIAHWQDFNPGIIQKAMRGFRHVECARLLRPLGLDFEDAAAREGLMNLDPHYLPGPTHFPAFLWPRGEPDPDNFYAGFMHGELAVLLILFGPSAAERDVAASLGRTRCIAEIYGIEAVTPALLAYAAMEVRFALDSQPSFGAGDKKRVTGKWPLREFYYHLLNHIERDMPMAAQRKLMDWWHARIFGSASYDGLEDGSATSSEHAVPSTAQLMLAQAARMEEEHARSRDASQAPANGD